MYIHTYMLYWKYIEDRERQVYFFMPIINCNSSQYVFFFNFLIICLHIINKHFNFCCPEPMPSYLWCIGDEMIFLLFYHWGEVALILTCLCVMFLQCWFCGVAFFFCDVRLAGERAFWMDFNGEDDEIP